VAKTEKILVEASQQLNLNPNAPKHFMWLTGYWFY